MVIALIAILAGLLLPALATAKSRARATLCLGNLKQIGLAVVLYAGDHDERLPQSQHSRASWVGTLQPYLGGTNLHRCPEDANKHRIASFAINDFLTPHPYGARELDFSRATSIPAPSETAHFAGMHRDFDGSDHFHFADAQDAGYSTNAFPKQVAVERHRGAANYLFADSHAQSLPWKIVRPTLGRPGSRFVRPDGHPASP